MHSTYVLYKGLVRTSCRKTFVSWGFLFFSSTKWAKQQVIQRNPSLRRRLLHSRRRMTKTLTRSTTDKSGERTSSSFVVLTVRLWGLHGQERLHNSHIVLLGAGPAGSETLKNLVLPGLLRVRQACRTVVYGVLTVGRHWQVQHHRWWKGDQPWFGK